MKKNQVYNTPTTGRYERRYIIAILAPDLWEIDYGESFLVQIPTAFLPIDIKPQDSIIFDYASFTTFWNVKDVRTHVRKKRGITVAINERLMAEMLPPTKYKTAYKEWCVLELERLGKLKGGIGNEVAKPVGLV